MGESEMLGGMDMEELWGDEGDDRAYLAAIEGMMEEWESESDDLAYGNLESVVLDPLTPNPGGTEP